MIIITDNYIYILEINTISACTKRDNLNENKLVCQQKDYGLSKYITFKNFMKRIRI